MEITDEQIEQLKAEAAQAGDSKMVAICDRALYGCMPQCDWRAARKACAEAIEAAKAMAD